MRDILGHTSITVTERSPHLAPSVSVAAAAATPRVNLPNICPATGRRRSKTPVNPERATLDSNQWPSAPETFTIGNDHAVVDVFRADGGQNLREAAEQDLRALVARKRFAHRYAMELAEGVLDLLRVPRSALDRPSLRPGDQGAHHALEFAAVAVVAAKGGR